MADETSTCSDDTRAFLSEAFFDYLRRQAPSSVMAGTAFRESFEAASMPAGAPANFAGSAGQPEQLAFEFNDGSDEFR